MSFAKQFVFALHNNISRNTFFAIKRRLVLEVQIWYDVSKSSQRVNSYIVYIVVQIFALKRSLSNVTLCANNRHSSNIRVLFANSNDAKRRFKLDLRSRRSSFLVFQFYISIYLSFAIFIST